MAATDHPLKRLVSLFIDEFAAWLLNSPVREARPLNVELLADRKGPRHDPNGCHLAKPAWRLIRIAGQWNWSCRHHQEGRMDLGVKVVVTAVGDPTAEHRDASSVCDLVTE